jgi:propane 2-monooxygenase large subunit
MKLGKLGLDIPPDMFERARERLVAGVHHRHAILAFAGWPLSFWRFDPLDERDFEWFENKYPGWYAQYGAFWEAYRQGIDPDAGFLPLDFINMAPPFCWTCQGLCVAEGDRRHRVVSDRTRFYCSAECRWLDESNPGRYTGDRNWLDRYDGWEASEVVRDLGFVRADGETLIGQPHLGDGESGPARWTLSDIRAHDLKLQSPNIRVARELGLPSGDWSDSPRTDGAVPLDQAQMVM